MSNGANGANWDLGSKPAGQTESRELDLMTVDQAAEYLQLSQSSIRSYIRQGKLKAFRIAGLRKVLIPKVELLTLLEPTNFGNLGSGQNPSPKIT